MPFSKWAGFAYNQLGWSRIDFWSATIWDVLSAIHFHNEAHGNKKHGKSKKEIENLHKRMKIKGRI